jgi:hypothetical protein
MVRATDDTENVTFTGIVSVLPHPITESGDGSIEVTGSLYTDNISSNTLSGPVNLQGTKFIDKTQIFTNTLVPVNPGVNENVFYTENNLLKSKGSNGIVTTYQPTNTKGDLLTHNGTTQVRVPYPGDSKYYLSTDISTDTGLVWVKNVTSKKSKDKFTLIGNGSVTLIEECSGSFFSAIDPFNFRSPSSVIFFSRSDPGFDGHVVNLVRSPRINSNTMLAGVFKEYEPIEVNTVMGNSDGDYVSNSNNGNLSVTIQLSGTNYTTFPQALDTYEDIHFISIHGKALQGSGTYVISKSDKTSNTFIATTITSSPFSGGTFSFLWNANETLKINKTTSQSDGDYTIIKNLDSSEYEEVGLVLNGTSITEHPYGFYTKKSTFVKITSDIQGAPCSFFIISKNTHLNNGNTFSIRLPGKNSQCKINLVWGIESQNFQISKTTNDYSGNYKIIVFK